eukprot:scaffold1767_cov64-Attheya_sp.AAC.3
METDEDGSLSSFQNVYRSLLFLVLLYLAGDVLCGKFLRIVPSLVGQIFCGVVFGPSVLNLVSTEFSTLGEMGLVLLICQAGLEMDFETLKKVGPRGGVMAIVGSILPMSLGFILSYKVLNLELKSAIAAGCSFGPTSAGIAMNVLEQCGVLKSQLGQLIVAIAIVDDIFALVVLSQLRALTSSKNGESVNVTDIVIPIVSAILWLVVGGVVALYVMPTVFEKLYQLERRYFEEVKDNVKHDGEEEGDNDQDDSPSLKENVETSVIDPQSTDSLNNATTSDDSLQCSSALCHVVILLFALLPATHYSQASSLCGAFLAGLSACQDPHASRAYNQQLAIIIQWLMRIFFGATIAFQIPIQLFNNSTVIGNGFLLSLSLLGKVMTGPLLTPVIATDGRRWDGQHLRDCAIVGLSMAGEAEFAFLLAGFGLSEGLLSQEIYASVVFAILLSTVMSPVLLRTTLAVFPEKKNCNSNSRHSNVDGRSTSVIITEHNAELNLSQYDEDLP